MGFLIEAYTRHDQEEKNTYTLLNSHTNTHTYLHANAHTAHHVHKASTKQECERWLAQTYCMNNTHTKLHCAVWKKDDNYMQTSAVKHD